MKSTITLALIFMVCSCGSNQNTNSDTTAKSVVNDKPTPFTQTEPQNSNKTLYQKLSFKDLNNYRLLKKMAPSPFDTNVVIETEEEKNEYVNKQVPEEIKKLTGTNIEICGYAFPAKLSLGKSSAIVLMSVVPSCCYGDVLKLSDLIYVDAPNSQENIRENQYIRVKGKLTVVTKQLENQSSRFIYWVKADSIEMEIKKN